jgi:Asp-tRNA(Asn)/Glu-tRNA(Gln) amidotransferase A subunit family amidase
VERGAANRNGYGRGRSEGLRSRAVTAYDLRSVELPRLAGTGLRLFAAALETPGIGPVLLAKLVKDAGVDVLATAEVDDPPRPLPLVPARLPDPARVDPPVSLAPLEGLSPEGPFVSAFTLARAYRAGATDPVAVAERALAACEALGPEQSIFIAQDREDVLGQARASQARLRAGSPRSILEGVPVAVKDELDMTPYPTTVGTRFLGRAPATADATCVARLRAAGAVLLGKANMHEIGINPNGANPHHGLVRNPYDRARDSGGSSSGSAAAVASGLCPLAVGADGGGSVRIPAALCGVAGLKATYGRVSEHGAAPLCWSVAHVGPIGATVADVALGYALMAGPDPQDPSSMVQPALTLAGVEEARLDGLRVGVYTPWLEHAAPDVVATTRAALRHLEAAGARVVEVQLPHLDLIRVAHAVTILAEMATAMDRYPEEAAALAPHVRVNLLVGRRFTGTDYIRAQRVRAKAMGEMDALFQQVDLLATPTTAITAPKIPVTDPRETWSDLSTVTEVMRYVFLTNLTGHPGLTVPAGYDEAGLPVGLQLTADHWQEALLFRAGLAVEARVQRRLPPEYTALWAEGAR